MCLGCDLWKSEFLTCFSFYVFVFVYIFFSLILTHMFFWIFDFAYFELVERFHLLFDVLLDGFVDMADRWSWFATRILFMTLILFTRASRKRLGTLQYSQCVSKRSQLKSYTYHMLIICFFLSDSRIQALTTSPPDQSRPGRCKYFWQQLLLPCIFFSL